LFNRNSRSVELTAAGTAFLAHARASLAAAIDARAAVAATERAASGRLPMSMSGEALDYAREFLQAFAAAYSDGHLDVTLKFKDASKEALARRNVDASILWSGDQPPPGFADTSAMVAAPGAGIALSASHPLAMLPEVALDRLDGQRLIMFPRERAADMYDVILDGLGAPRASARYITSPRSGKASELTCWMRWTTNRSHRLQTGHIFDSHEQDSSTNLWFPPRLRRFGLSGRESRRGPRARWLPSRTRQRHQSPA
jgi:DNA-binding transcriptional LysR family regulator